MTTFPPAFHTAQILGLTGAAWLSGNIFTHSMNITPSLLESLRKNQIPPSTAVQLWSLIYGRGKAQNPPIAAATAAAFLFLAWSAREGTSLAVLSPPRAGVLYTIAAALTVGIVPYTVVFMGRTNGALLAGAKAEAESKESVAEVESLLSRWKVLNAVRGVFPLLASVVGLVVALP